MVRLHEVINVKRPIEWAFAYTADFANSQRWDPGVASSTRVGDGPVAVGSSFELMVAFGGRQTPMTYTVTVYEPSTRVVLEGVGSTLTAVDDIRFATAGDGTEVTYTADLSFKGVLRFAEPFLRPFLNRVGERAVAGLARELDAPDV